MPETIDLTVLINAEDDDSEGLDRATRQLRTELQELPIDAASLTTAGQPPAGAKSAEAISLGALTLSLAPVVVPALLDLLKSWIGRRAGRKVVIRKKTGDTTTEIEITSPLSDSEIASLAQRLSA